MLRKEQKLDVPRLLADSGAQGKSLCRASADNPVQPFAYRVQLGLQRYTKSLVWVHIESCLVLFNR